VSENAIQSIDITNCTISENVDLPITINLVVDNETAKNVPADEATQHSIIDLNPSFLNNSYNLVKNQTAIKPKETLASYISNFDGDLSLKSSPSTSQQATDPNQSIASQQSKCSCCCACNASRSDTKTSVSNRKCFRKVKKPSVYRKYKSPKARLKRTKLFSLKRRSIPLKAKLSVIANRGVWSYDAANFDEKIKNNRLLLAVYNHLRTISLCKDYLFLLRNFVGMSVRKNFTHSDDLLIKMIYFYNRLLPFQARKNKASDGLEPNGEEKVAKKNKSDDIYYNDTSM
jgi:hypothetical protein